MQAVRHLLLVGCASMAAVGLVACGDSDDKATSNATPAAVATDTTAAEPAGSPESVLAPDAAVATGLKALAKVGDAIAAVPDETASKKASEGLEPVWSKVEGTVKKNDPDSYATVEEDLTLLESGDQTKTKSGAAELSKTIDGYLAKYPG